MSLNINLSATCGSVLGFVISPRDKVGYQKAATFIVCNTLSVHYMVLNLTHEAFKDDQIHPIWPRCRDAVLCSRCTQCIGELHPPHRWLILYIVILTERVGCNSSTHYLMAVTMLHTSF